MAINWIEDGALFASSPSWYRRVGYEEIGRDASTVTIRVHLQLKLKGSGSSTFYGFPAYWNVNDGGTMQIKGSERWYGGQDYRGYSTDIRVGANAGGGSGSFKIHMWSSSGGNAGFTQNFSFNYSKWNTKPYWIGGNKITLRENNAGGRVISSEAWGTENACKFAENIGAIYVDWGGQARDNENNPLTYELWMQCNEGGWSIIYSGNNTNFVHNIGSGAGTQGYSYDYYVKVRDSFGEWADGECNATQIQKNQLYQAMLNHSGNVAFDTATINLSRTNASNSNGNGSFTYRLSSNDITVYNGDKISGNSIPVTIYRSGDAPSTPYIRWDDLKRFLAGNNYNRNLRFVLTTTNAYGSSNSDIEDVWCDIRKNPTAFSFNSVSGVTTVNGKSYYIPSEKSFTMTWGASTDPVGTPVTYDLYYAYDNVSWNLLASNLTSNTFTAKLPNVNKLTILTFRVVAKTAYGTSTATEGGRTEVHYVGIPNVTLKLTRNQSNYIVDGKVDINSSIPNLTLSSVKYRVGSSTTDIDATISGLTFKVTRNLAETSSESLTFYVKDRGNNDLGRPATTQSILISRYMPMFSIREKGVGVNTIPSGKAKLEVSGGLYVDGKYLGNTRHFGSRQITVGGDANTYYPVLLVGGSGFATNRISISRGYNWQAPDTWNTATHRGGLTLTFTWAGDTTWGGNSRVYNVEEFSETYTTMVAGLTNTTGGFIVWLRGGGAIYQIDNDYGYILRATVYLESYTAPDKNVYSPRKDVSNVQKELMPNYCVRGTELYSNNQKVLTNADLSSNGTRNKVAFIRPDGVMEVGRYIDFHYEDNNNDYDGRLSIAGNGNLVYNHAIEATYLTVTDGGRLQINGNGKNLLIGTGGADCYLTNNKTNTYLQLRDNGDLTYTGKVCLDTYAPSLYNAMITINTSRDGNGNGDGNTHFGYNGGNGYSHYFRGTGGVYVDCHKGLNAWDTYTRFLRSPSGQNVDIVADSGQMYFDVKSASGCGLIMDRRWGGSNGSEICLLNNKGNGWGFIGNSGQAFYRIYGNAGSVSDRARKYDIHKYDVSYLYEQVKNLNVYAYRTISDEVDEDGNQISELKRSDMQLGCMIQELPFEVVLCDAEGGNGKAVDVYAYTTMILGATQIAQQKIETLENKVEDLEKELAVQNKNNEDLANRLEEIERILKEHGIN
ncbi:hypothetical protein UT300009_29720 [Paraclostridium bifermentans]